jgi:hypothetical protein
MMLSIHGAFLAVLLALGAGSGISNAVQANASAPAYDPVKTNVNYDLAVLFGDTNKDGKVDENEYDSFDINTLAPNAGSADVSFRFLGFRPLDGKMVFYVYSLASLQTLDPDTGIWHSNSYAYTFSYQNSVQSNASGTGYDGDDPINVVPVICNSYRGTTGCFSKFVIDPYDSRTPGPDYRINALSMKAIDNATRSTVFYSDIVGGELLYNSSYLNSDAVSEFFSSKTYSLSGVLDGCLAVDQSVTTPEGKIFWIPYGNSAHYTSALELYYFFFNFDDVNFNVSDVTSVTYRYNQLTWNYGHFSHYFYNDVGGQTGTLDDGISTLSYDKSLLSIAQGRSDSVHLWDQLGNGKTVKYSDDLTGFSSVSKTGKTDKGEIKVTETSTAKGFWLYHTPIVRDYSLAKIVNVANVDKDYPGDDKLFFRNFIKGTGSDEAMINSMAGASDHSSYHWAYCVTEPDWIRSTSSVTVNDNPPVWNTNPDGSVYLFANGVIEGKTTTVCHQPDMLTTLSMNVVTPDGAYSIKTINNPATVRKNYMIGYAAPTLGDFVANDITKWFENNPWIWAVLALVIVILVVVLFAVFPVIINVIKYIFKALWWIFKAIVEVLYFVIFWWWYAAFAKLTHAHIPPANIWKLGHDDERRSE